jgi:hypothetical protein
MLLRRTLAAITITIAAATTIATAGVAGAVAPSTGTSPQSLTSSLRCAYYHARYHLSPHDTLDTSGADNEWWVKGAMAGCDFVLWD